METTLNDLSLNDEEEDDLSLAWSIALRADRRRNGPEPSRWLRGADGMAIQHYSTTGVGDITTNSGDLSHRVSPMNHINQGRRSSALNNVVLDADVAYNFDEDCPFLVHEGNKRQRARSIPSPNVSVADRLAECRCSLLTWSRSLSGDVRYEIKQLERDIIRLRGSLGVSSDQDDVYVQKKSRLQFLVAQEDIRWRQRAKVFWLQSGDFNSRFFHLHASGRKRYNVIQGLYGSDGLWTEEQDAMQSIAHDYFSNLFLEASRGGWAE
ncbi:hypothetical protein ACFE04_022799 [Oxalis oulophora]